MQIPDCILSALYFIMNLSLNATQNLRNVYETKHGPQSQVRRNVPVSYTHLDVYKRQAVGLRTGASRALSAGLPARAPPEQPARWPVPSPCFPH